MNQEIKIDRANYISDYKIEIHFDDGTVQTVDFESFLKSSKNEDIRKYLQLDLFKTFRVVDGDLDWNDFDLCFPVYDLYRNAIKKSPTDSEAAS